MPLQRPLLLTLTRNERFRCFSGFHTGFFFCRILEISGHHGGKVCAHSQLSQRCVVNVRASVDGRYTRGSGAAFLPLYRSPQRLSHSNVISRATYYSQPASLIISVYFFCAPAIPTYQTFHTFQQSQPRSTSATGKPVSLSEVCQ